MKTIAFLLFSLVLAAGAGAQTAGYYNTRGVAIKGYDPVAYFTQAKALAGSDAFTYAWGGSTWKFISQDHRDSFILAPQRYAPQFGGWCAYGCSEQHQSPTDPNAWTIKDGRLYLNYSAKVKELWVKDTVARIPAAISYWQKLAQ